jgi:hypothetical protein
MRKEARFSEGLIFHSNSRMSFRDKSRYEIFYSKKYSMSNIICPDTNSPTT